MDSENTNNCLPPLLSREGVRETEVVLTFKLWHLLPQDRPPVDSFRSILELGGAVEVLQELAITQTMAEGHVVIATWQKIEISDHLPSSSHTEVY